MANEKQDGSYVRMQTGLTKMTTDERLSNIEANIADLNSRVTGLEKTRDAGEHHRKSIAFDKTSRIKSERNKEERWK